jgi:hypothetical protein
MPVSPAAAAASGPQTVGNAPPPPGSIRDGLDITSGLRHSRFPLQQTDLPDIRATPSSFLSIYKALDPADPEGYVRRLLGPAYAALAAPGCLATFAAVIAFNAAPQGDADVDPLPATLGQLLASPALACGHSCKLTVLLSVLGYPGILPPDAPAGAPAKPTVHMLVWLPNNPLNTGVHSQLVLANVFNDAYLLIDPLYAYVLRVPFGGVTPDPAQQVIVNAANLLATPAARGQCVIFGDGVQGQAQVVAAMTRGQMNASFVYHDALYGSEGWDIALSQIVTHMG